MYVASANLMKAGQSVCTYTQELELNKQVRKTLLALAEYLKEVEAIMNREDKKAVPNPVAYFNGSAESSLDKESTLQSKYSKTYETFRRALEDLLQCYKEVGFYDHEKIKEDFAVRMKQYPEILKEVSFMNDSVFLIS